MKAKETLIRKLDKYKKNQGSADKFTLLKFANLRSEFIG
jgi:hypothetical protein